MTLVNAFGDIALDASVQEVADGVGAIADASVSAGATGSLSAKLRRLSADLSTALGYLDGVETLLTTIDGRVDGLEGFTDGIETLLAGTLTTKALRSATGTTSQVSDNASNVTLLASNANRLGATIVNTSTVNLYAKCGTTATTSDFTVLIPPNGYWEVPFNYTGKIDGIWASDPNTGAAAVTEFTA